MEISTTYIGHYFSGFKSK